MDCIREDDLKCLKSPMERPVNGKEEATLNAGNVSNCFGVEIQKRYHSKYYKIAVSEEGTTLVEFW